MTADKWYALSREQYIRIFKGSAVKRAKYEGLLRNIANYKAINFRKEEEQNTNTYK
jgi:epoxyqueuosine reductase